MSKQAISLKFQPSSGHSILNFVSASLFHILENSKNIRNQSAPESLKTKEINYFQISDKIYGFSNLKSNWDSYNADAIHKRAIEKSIQTLNYLQINGFLSSAIELNVFPMRDGGVQFEFDGPNMCSEIEINKNGELNFILFDNNGNIESNVRLFELPELSMLLEEAQSAGI